MIAPKDRSPPKQSGTPNSDRLNRTAPVGEIIQIIINKNLRSKIMKTAQLNGSAVNGKSDVKNIPLVNGGTVNKVEAKTEEVKDIAKSIDLKNVEQVKQEAPATKVEQPKAEPTKMEIKEQQKEEKPAMNLEATIKLALDLNRRINQRGKLLETIGTLEAFEVAQKDDAEETDSTHFQRCELTIGDDKGREFTTKNPFIINAVAKMVNTLCVDKLAEIEGEIFIPVK